MALNDKEQVHFWRELERVEQWLSRGAGSAAGRIYDTMGRPGERTLLNYGNELVAGVARVERVRQALDQSGPMAKRLAMQQLSGIGLSDVWEILIAACKEIALYYGGAVVAGAVVGGAIGSLAFGAGAVPGAIAGGAAGSQVGLWVLTLLGLKDLAVGLGTMFPAAMEHYERGFREAWGAVPDNRRDFGNSAALPSGSSSAGAWHMGQGHVILVTAILTAVVAYLTRGGTSASLAQMARQSRSLGSKFANWAVKNEGRLLAHPQLQSRPNNSVAMAMEEAVPDSGRGTSSAGAGERINSAEVNSENGSRLGFRMNKDGPTTIVARDPVDLAGQRRLNGIDLDRNAFAPGEAGAAAEIEHYLGGTLKRAAGGTSADYIVESGAFAGARIDLKLTPDTFAQAEKINRYFDKTFPKFSQSFADKLANPAGVDMMPFDTRFLTAENKKKLLEFVNTLPKSSQQKVIYLED